MIENGNIDNVVISPDINIHTYILREIKENLSNLRVRMHRMENIVAVQTHAIDNVDKNLIGIIENQKSFSKSINEIKVEMALLNHNDEKRKSMSLFIKELLDKPKSWFIVAILISATEAFHDIPLYHILLKVYNFII
jgi:hypothetical protein